MSVITKKAEILKHTERAKKLIDVPEWGDGVQVWIQELSAADRDDYEQSLTTMRRHGKRTDFEPNLANSKARFAVKCIVDEDGKRIFKDHEAKELGKIGAAALNRIVEEGYKLSGMSREEVDEMSENLSSDQSEDSPSN